MPRSSRCPRVATTTSTSRRPSSTRSRRTWAADVRAVANPVAALLEPGYRVDRYELLAKIGQGGMASVWLARAEGQDGFFAIKTILPEHAGDDMLRKMMLDEARIAMGISHPNVALTLEVGQLWDMPYLVLEYVAGESLDQLCQALETRKATMPPEIAVR